MDDRRRAGRWVDRILAGLLAAAALTGPTVDRTRAVDSTDDVLGGAFADVALIDPAGIVGPLGAAPRVLAVRAGVTGTPGALDVVVLQAAQGDTWQVIDEALVATGIADPGPARLVPLDGRFALVATEAAISRTSVTLLDPADLAAGRPSTMVRTTDSVGVGAVDVDGDGTHELVMSTDASSVDARVGATPVDGDGKVELVIATGAGSLDPRVCPGMHLRVFEGRSLAIRASFVLTGVAIDGAVVGRFGPGGAERLFGHSRPECQGGAGGEPTGSVVIDPRSGDYRPIDAGTIGPPLVGYGGLAAPMIADFDHDGIDEPILRDGSATVVLDPTHDWRPEMTIVLALPLAVVDGRAGPRLAIDRSDDAGASRVEIVDIGRNRPGAEVSERDLAAFPLDLEVIPGLGLPAASGTWSPAWVGDLDGTDRLTVLLPSETVHRSSGDGEVWTAEPGPPWLQTVPLAAYGEPGARRLLVAAGVDWEPSGAGLAVPSPEAITAVQRGRWRTQPSPPFVLQVVDVARLTARPDDVSLAVPIDPLAIAGRIPEVGLGASPGHRLFVRSVGVDRADPATDPAATANDPADPTSEPTDPALDPIDFLLSSSDDAAGRVSLMARPVGATGTGPTTTRAPLAPDAQAWLVDVVALDALGWPSAVAHARVELDTTGPGLTVEAPFATIPWPFSNRIAGRAEPGARVRLGTGPFVAAAPDGSFAFDQRLAPWPQDLEFEAIDRAGNSNTQTISVVGGVDYRRLPLQALVVVLILLGATATTWGRPSIRRRRASPVPDTATDGIEDLPTIGGRGS